MMMDGRLADHQSAEGRGYLVTCMIIRKIV